MQKAVNPAEKEWQIQLGSLQKEIRNINKQIKTCSNSLVIREINIKTAAVHCLS